VLRDIELQLVVVLEARCLDLAADERLLPWLPTVEVEIRSCDQLTLLGLVQ
jgi:hypothetical protein